MWARGNVVVYVGMDGMLPDVLTENRRGNGGSCSQGVTWHPTWPGKVQHEFQEFLADLLSSA